MVRRLLTIFIYTILFCYSSFSVAEEQYSYIDSLKNSFSGNHNFTASGVRSLCKEISGTENPSYNYRLGKEKITPSNKFTICYDKEKKNLQALGNKRAGEVAKIVCRYEAR